MRVPSFRNPPPPEHNSRLWLVVSVAAHVFLVGGFFGAIVFEEEARSVVTFVRLGESPGAPTTEIELPWEELLLEGAGSPVVQPQMARPPLAAAPPRVRPIPVAPVEPDVGIAGGDPNAGGGDPIVLGDSGGVTGPVIAGNRGRRIRGPSYGTGRLWVAPTRVVTDLDEALALLEGLNDLDTLLAMHIVAFLDSLSRDPFAVASAPSWTTEINGQTFGIDGRWVHLGPIKIPTMLLALLPLPQGNIDEARAYEQLQLMRQQVQRQAQMMQNRAEINEYIQEMRERIDAEREQDRRQGGRAPAFVPPDTLIP